MAATQVTQLELNLTVLRILELAYHKNEGVTSRLVHQKGHLTLTVDHKGNATLAGEGGGLAFAASDAFRELGAAVKGVTVLMSVNDEGKIKFSGSFRIGPFAQATVRGIFDVEEFLTACSGILCRATRFLQNRPAQIDHQLKQALGY